MPEEAQNPTCSALLVGCTSRNLSGDVSHLYVTEARRAVKILSLDLSAFSMACFYEVCVARIDHYCAFVELLSANDNNTFSRSEFLVRHLLTTANNCGARVEAANDVDTVGWNKDPLSMSCAQANTETFAWSYRNIGHQETVAGTGTTSQRPVSGTAYFIVASYRPDESATYSIDMSWNRRIKGLLSTHVSLVTANAFISTLGGGHFLCRQVHHARAMALRQIVVALRMEDYVLAGLVWVNIAYGYMQEGKFGTAQRILRRVKRVFQNDGVEAARSAAVLYLRSAAALTRDVDLASTPQAVTFDNYYRQRIISPSSIFQHNKQQVVV